jgi:hypothetical protein
VDEPIKGCLLTVRESESNVYVAVVTPFAARAPLKNVLYELGSITPPNAGGDVERARFAAAVRIVSECATAAKGRMVVSGNEVK